MKAKTHTYDLSFIYAHIPTYESKDNYFFQLTPAKHGTIYLIDFTNI